MVCCVMAAIIEDEVTGMTDAELKKLRRTDLLEMLLEQSKETEALRSKVAELEAALADRELKIENAGSIAEAALMINGVVEATEQAAKQYLDNIQNLSARQEEICEQKIAETDAYVQSRMSELSAREQEVEETCRTAEENCANRCTAQEMALKERCDFMKEEAERFCQEKQQETAKQCEEKERETAERCQNMEQEAKERCSGIEAEISQRYAAMEQELEEKYGERVRKIEADCAAREQEAEEYCKRMAKKAEQDVEARWNVLSVRLEEFYRAHEGLRDLLTSSGGISLKNE